MADSKPKPKPEPTQPQEQDQPALSYLQQQLNLQNVTFPANDCNYTLNYSHANHHTMIPTPGNTRNDVNNHTDNNNVVHHHMPEFTNNDHHRMPKFTYNDHHRMPEFTYNDHHRMPEFTDNDVYYNDTDNNNGFFDDVVNNNVNNNTRPIKVKLMADIPKEDEAYLETFPQGYRFHPYDFELIVFYLKRKVENKFLPPNKIRSVNLYLYHPNVLIEAISDEHMPENVWYFFTPRDRKYPNGSRPNRAAGKEGYWKATGADKSIEHEQGAEKSIVGYRKALVFYEGTAPNGVKTNWIMHEYRLNQPPRNKINADDMKLDDWVLCKLHKKVDRSTKISRDGEPSWGDGEPNLIYHNSTYLSNLGVDYPFVTRNA